MSMPGPETLASGADAISSTARMHSDNSRPASRAELNVVMASIKKALFSHDDLLWPRRNLDASCC
jgi:hypothetical protein